MCFDQFDRRQFLPPDFLGHGDSRKERQLAHAISIRKRIESSMRFETGTIGEDAAQKTRMSFPAREKGNLVGTGGRAARFLVSGRTHHCFRLAAALAEPLLQKLS